MAYIVGPRVAGRGIEDRADGRAGIVGGVPGEAVREGGGVAVEDGGAGEVVVAVGEEDGGVAGEELVAEERGEQGPEGGVGGRERVEDDGAGHDVRVAREGLGQARDEAVRGGEHVEVGKGAHRVVDHDGEGILVGLSAVLGKKGGGLRRKGVS